MIIGRRRRKMGGGATGSNSDIFSKNGPSHLVNCINWLNFHHRTAVAASLVQGVYSMQRDKHTKRKPQQASPWWESFGFSLDKSLINKADGSIYGAVFKYDNSKNIPDQSGTAPLYVVAFRGTTLSSETWFSDLKQDCRCLFNNLNQGSRFDQAIHAIKTVVEERTGGETKSVWLAGHSLGAGVALLAGKAMVKRYGSPMDTYAFNPPNLSFPLEILPGHEVFKGLVRITESIVKGTFALLFDFQTEKEDPRTAAWAPYLYLNPSDIICAEFIGVMKRKIVMGAMGLSKLENAGARISLRSMLFGGEGTPLSMSAEPIQFLSAEVTVNMNESDFDTVHGLEQWWNPDPALLAKLETQSIKPSINY